MTFDVKQSILLIAYSKNIYFV